ncbi:MAG: ABC transporter substrate-binding protein [Dehalococcoidia bacterium]|nr:MAG: ABC transporter substrate-binding protein [Dehalococcoidia bacterium]
MKKWSIVIAVVMALALLLTACPAPPTSDNGTNGMPDITLPTDNTTKVVTLSGEHLTQNPVETQVPIYGGTLIRGYWIPRTFDSHQKASYGPTATLPVFNQLVMFDINYKEVVPETIIGDLAESWETRADGTEIIFHLRQGVKWHDGVPFSADDVIYSMDKMVDVTRSAISDWFPAYERTEKIDDNTVKIHLKYASAGFMLALAQGESQIQPLHLAGTDAQSAAFMVGTGPFMLTEYLTQVHLKFKRNPDYFRKDKYGNRLPYLDGMVYHHLGWTRTTEMMVGRRLDILDTTTGAGRMDTYNLIKDGAPEVLWQRRDRYNGSIIIINLNSKPLDDIRVRRAMGLLINEEDLIFGYAGSTMWGIPDSGILSPAWGLPKEEVIKLMGWDMPWDERVAEAQRLMAEACYPEGFKMNAMSAEADGTRTAATLVFVEALRKYLKIETDVSSGLGTIEIEKRLKDNRYDTYTRTLEVMDPVQLTNFFGTGEFANYANYSNPEIDKKLAELDRILDPDARREAIWEIERILLTDLPALPTGLFIPNFMPYYPWVKNLRWNDISYSNINRVEDVWLDESLRVK